MGPLLDENHIKLMFHSHHYLHNITIRHERHIFGNIREYFILFHFIINTRKSYNSSFLKLLEI